MKVDTHWTMANPDLHVPPRCFGIATTSFAVLVTLSLLTLLRGFWGTNSHGMMMTAQLKKDASDERNIAVSGKSEDSEEQEILLLRKELNETKHSLSQALTRASSLHDELQSSYSSFLIHTPKTGGYSLFSMLASDRSELSIVEPSIICNHFDEDLEWRDWPRCWLHATESPFSTEPARRFAMVRNPRHHVPSMYYHCTESDDSQ